MTTLGIISEWTIAYKTVHDILCTFDITIRLKYNRHETKKFRKKLQNSNLAFDIGFSRIFSKKFKEMRDSVLWFSDR